MEAYINGLGNISPQKTFDNSNFLEEVSQPTLPYLTCAEPNYKEFMAPMQLRRMGRILKMGVTASRICLKDAGIEKPDAIITGTGLGLMQDTEKFLTSLIDNNEMYLNPTSFIQSTHNTVGAHIAVMLKCNKYNYTFVHSDISFESALLDSLMQLEENPDSNILLGGLDEMTEQHFQITEKAGFWNYDNSSEKGNEKIQIIPGEGASFFVLSNKRSEKSYAKFDGVKTFYKPSNTSEIQQKIKHFIEGQGISNNDIDLVIFGQQNNNPDQIYRSVSEGLFANSIQTYYKHLCGEYNTSSAFAAWLATKILKLQSVPEQILLNGEHNKKPINKILIYNHVRNIYHSLILLSAND